MENFNALLTLSELKTLYSKKPVGICPLYKGAIGVTKRFEVAGNPVVLPDYINLEKLQIEFSPKQAGSGDPSPENVRPISGRDTVKVTVSNEDESHDYPLALPETIYDGTVDAVSGEGSKVWDVVILNSVFLTEYKWLYGAIGRQTSPVLYGKISPASTGTNNAVGYCYCSHFKQGSTIPIKDLELYSKTSYFGNRNIAIRNDTWTSLDDAKAWLDAQESAGTPVTVCYKLATPEPFQATGNQPIPSLGSENNFFTNGENLDIIYKVSLFWG